MAYKHYDSTKPDAATQNGTDFGSSTRDNMKSLRDMVVAGFAAGWDFSKSGGSGSQPTTVTYAKGVERLKVDLTYGTTGGAEDNVETATYSYSSDSGSAYSSIGTRTITYDSESNPVAVVWS